MARVIGPNNVPIPSAATQALPRADGDDFGAQVGRATRQVGASIGDVGKALSGYVEAQQKLEERRRAAEDAAFLDAADLELDTGYSRAFNDETTRARSGAERMTDTLTARLETDTEGVRARLTERGFRPSEEALQKFESLKIRRQHQYIGKSIAYENNERIRMFGDQLATNVDAITQRAIAGGDVRGGIDRIEQSIEAYRGIVPAPVLDEMRQKAAKEFVRNLKENADAKTLDRLTGDLFDAPGSTQPSLGGGISGKVDEAENPETRAKPTTGEAKPDGAVSITDYARGKGRITGPRAEAVSRETKPVSPGREEGGRFVVNGLRIVDRVSDDAEYGRSASRHAQPFKGIVLHHTGGDGADRFIKYGHSVDRARGGSFGYHFYIDKDGTIYQGAPMDKRTNHVKPVSHGQRKDASGLSNENAIGISLLGSGGDETPEQLAAVKQLAGSLSKTYSIPTSRILGHGELQNDRESREGQAALKAIRGEVMTATLEDPTMRGAFARELAAARGDIVARANALREKEADAERARMLIAGAYPVDPGSADDRKVVDKAWAASDLSTALQSGQPEAAEAVVKLAQETSYIPQGAMQSLRGMAVNGSGEQKIYAYQTVGRIMRERPGATGADKDFEADTTRFNTLVMDLGLTPQQAIAKIEETKTPEFQKAKKALAEDGAKLAKDLTVADITARHDGWFSSEPGFINDRARAEVQEAYREAFRMNYVETGDAEWAKKAAQNHLAQVYSTSAITGRKILMREPPEKYYPPIASRANGKPSMDYFTDDLKQTVRELAGKEIPLDKIIIRSGPTTFGDIARGNPHPSYDIGWIDEDENGIPAIRIAPRPFFVDVKAAKSKEAEVRQKALSQAHDPRPALDASVDLAQRAIMGLFD